MDMMHQGLVARANERAQRRLRAMVDAQAYPNPDAAETRLYVQAERLLDALITEAQWEAAKGEVDALIAADIAAGEVDFGLAAGDPIPVAPGQVGAWVEAELREAWGR